MVGGSYMSLYNYSYSAWCGLLMKCFWRWWSCLEGCHSGHKSVSVAGRELWLWEGQEMPVSCHEGTENQETK